MNTSKGKAAAHSKLKQTLVQTILNVNRQQGVTKRGNTVDESDNWNVKQ